MKSVVLALSAFAFSAASHATSPSPLPIAVTTDGQAYPLVSLMAQASAKVPTDEMVVSLRSEKEGANLGSLNQSVLSELQAALNQAKAIPGVHARMGNVHTNQSYSPQGKLVGWRVQGDIVLDSNKLKELGDLAGQLSIKLQLSNVYFRLSAEKRLEVEQSLLEDAAQAFRKKAKASAVALGYETFSIKDVSVSQGQSGGEPVTPMYAKAMMVREAASPSIAADAGETEVSVSMNGSVVLR